MALAQHKKNNTIPYREISYFCANKKISINWVLFEQLPKELEEQTVKYVKRVSLMIDGKIELISDNKNYTSQIMDYSDLEQFRIFGKVIGKVGEV